MRQRGLVKIMRLGMFIQCLWRRVCNSALGLLHSNTGNAAPLMAIMLVPIVGAMGMAVEGGNFFLANRAMQNAADTAALAAATNNCTVSGNCGGITYSVEAAAAAAQYGYVNGVGNTTVTPTSGVACPAPSTATNCYRVVISRPYALALTRIVHFNGDLNGSQTVSASAIARPRGAAAYYCMMALGTGNKALTLNGGPNVNLQGCSTYSNGDAKCNGNGGAPNFGISTSTVSSSSAGNNCGATQTVAAIADPFPGLASNIPASCAAPVTLPATGNTWNLSTNGPSNPACMTLPLTLPRDITITSATPGTVLVLFGNNDLNLNGHTLSATGGLTIVFTGATNKASGFPTGSGTVDFRAPTSGTWSGVALYQDPRQKAGSYTYSGNTPTFKLTGLIYAPKSDLTISGAINKSTAGLTCIGIIADNITINGNGSVIANATSECYDAGLALPTIGGTGGARQALVG